MLSTRVVALLEVVGVRKAYTRGTLWRKSVLRVLEGLDLRLEKGEAVALTGPNGCGKTTLLKVIAGLISADEGSVRLRGEPVDELEARRQIGLCTGDERSLHHRLTVRQNLDFHGALYGLRAGARDSRIDELASRLDLRSILDDRVDRCSSGMRARVNCARALLSGPALLLMDEPTKSLDSEHADRLWQLVRDRRDAGLAVVFSTHTPDEAATRADRIVALDAGKLVQLGGGGA